MKVTLYTTKYCPYSLRAKIALSEKKMTADIIEVGDLELDMIKKISYNGIFPVLMEKDYNINNRKALLIYIDERFPSPNLLPNIVNERIKIRLSLDKIDNEWYPVLDQIRKNRTNKKKLKLIFKHLKESLLIMEKAFIGSEFFISSGFTLADCYIAALIICLEAEGFILDKEYGAIYEYKRRIFSRESIKKANLKNNSSKSLLKTLRIHNR